MTPKLEPILSENFEKAAADLPNEISTREGQESLRRLLYWVKETLADVKESDTPVPVKALSAIIDAAEEFRLVNRQGMAIGIKFAFKEKSDFSGQAKVPASVALPVLSHICNETQRAVNILHRGGHRPRTSPLYGNVPDFNPLFP